jgi:hypothetical protein
LQHVILIVALTWTYTCNNSGADGSAHQRWYDEVVDESMENSCDLGKKKWTLVLWGR